ncbi:MAG: DUF294 nucleotidyltransferase-like domain-containing protein [Sulfurimonas sp.]|nr:DUF294 nucleotidyltransferase-like domain-containing protein [Sulfurimonas sp.]
MIVKNGTDVSLFEKPMLALNVALLELGYPKCSGNIMVSNEFWRRDVKGYKTLIDSWVNTLNEENLQNMSIFLDAKSVAGDASLLNTLIEYLHMIFHLEQMFWLMRLKRCLVLKRTLPFSSFVLQRSIIINWI